MLTCTSVVCKNNCFAYLLDADSVNFAVTGKGDAKCHCDLHIVSLNGSRAVAFVNGLLPARWAGPRTSAVSPGREWANHCRERETDSWPSQPVIADGSAVFRGWNRGIQNFSAFSTFCSSHFLRRSDPAHAYLFLFLSLLPLTPSLCVCVCVSGDATAGSFVYVHLSSCLDFWWMIWSFVVFQQLEMSYC